MRAEARGCALWFLLGSAVAALLRCGSQRPTRPGPAAGGGAFDGAAVESKFSVTGLLGDMVGSGSDEGRPERAADRGTHGAQPPPFQAKSKYAFVTMAYDEPGKPLGDAVWGALAIARAIRRVSRYPMVLLTNTTAFPDGTDLATGFAQLNVEVRPVHRLDLNGGSLMFSRWSIAYWKLQVWRLTEFEKLVWLDTDAILYRSVDWLFERDWMHAQRDDWFCQQRQPLVCSGIMLLFPNATDFHGLMSYSQEIGGSLTRGDQELISRYFQEVRKKPVKLLSDVEAAFGQCTGSAQSFYFDSYGAPVKGIWTTPAFMHKSGGWGNTNSNQYSDVCFSHRLERQRYFEGDTLVNACHLNPLAAHWRTNFCEAITLLGLYISDVADFCDDEIYYMEVNATTPPGKLITEGQPQEEAERLRRCAEGKGDIYHDDGELHPMVSLRAANGKFVVVDKAGHTRASAAHIDPTDRLEWVLNDDGTVSFKTRFCNYVSVEQDGRVLARYPTIGMWEKFTYETFDGGAGGMAFKSWSGVYVAAEPSGELRSSSRVSARSDRARFKVEGPWSTTTTTTVTKTTSTGTVSTTTTTSTTATSTTTSTPPKRPCAAGEADGDAATRGGRSLVALKAPNGNYVAADQFGAVSASAGTLPPSDRLQWVFNDNGTVSLKTPFCHYVSADAHNATLRAVHESIHKWERFRYEVVDGDRRSVALLSYFDKYVALGPNGTLRASAAKATEAAQFEVEGQWPFTTTSSTARTTSVTTTSAALFSIHSSTVAVSKEASDAVAAGGEARGGGGFDTAGAASRNATAAQERRSPAAHVELRAADGGSAQFWQIVGRKPVHYAGLTLGIVGSFALVMLGVILARKYLHPCLGYLRDDGTAREGQISTLPVTGPARLEAPSGPLEPVAYDRVPQSPTGSSDPGLGAAVKERATSRQLSITEAEDDREI